MPAPSSPKTDAFSRTTTSKPLLARPAAEANPPMPPPAMIMGRVFIAGSSLGIAIGMNIGAACRLIPAAQRRRLRPSPTKELYLQAQMICMLIILLPSRSNETGTADLVALVRRRGDRAHRHA